MTARERGQVDREIAVGEFPRLNATEGAGMEAGKSQRTHPPVTPCQKLKAISVKLFAASSPSPSRFSSFTFEQLTSLFLEF